MPSKKKKANASAGSKYWSVVKNEAEKSATINIHGEIASQPDKDWWTGEIIDDDTYTCPQLLEQDLENLGDVDEITLDINSLGGDAYTGIAIHNRIKSLDAKVNVVVSGVAASAASIIAMAGDTIQMYPGSMMMIHGVSTCSFNWMTQKDAENVAQWLSVLNKAISTIYSDKTGADFDDVFEMITDGNEHWMNSDVAVEDGYATEIIEDADPVVITASADRKFAFVNGVKMHARNVTMPMSMPVNKASKAPSQSGKGSVKNKTTKKARKEFKDMDIEDLKKENPDLYKEIVDEARKSAEDAERQRIREIDEIADSISDAEMVNEAKYGEEKIDAKTLAFNALKKYKAENKAANAKALADMQSESASSGASKVEPSAPKDDVSDEEKEKAKDQAKFDEVMNMMGLGKK